MRERPARPIAESVLPAWLTHAIDLDRPYPDADALIALAIELARRNVEHATGGPFGAAPHVSRG